MKLTDIIEEKSLTRNSLALKAEIAPGDLYCALSGKRPFYPAWRKRISRVLGMNEAEVFPEYVRGAGE